MEYLNEITSIGGLHQFRHVPYVHEAADGDVRCMLCKTGWMDRNQRVSHFHGSRHQRNYDEFNEALQQRRKEAEVSSRHERATLLWSRSISIQHKSWRNEVQAVLGKYLVDGEACLLSEAAKRLDVCEAMERTSLLELAIIKIRLCDGVIFKSMEEVRLQEALSKEFRCSEYIKTLSVRSGAQVIIPNVVQFL